MVGRSFVADVDSGGDCRGVGGVCVEKVVDAAVKNKKESSSTCCMKENKNNDDDDVISYYLYNQSDQCKRIQG